MRILLDSNILGRYVNRGDPHHSDTVRALRMLFANGDDLLILPQNIYEFCDFAGRSKARNGLDMPPTRILAAVRLFRRIFILEAPDSAAELFEYLSLQNQLQIYGIRSHDLRLVAACRDLGITHILTLNPKDFEDAEQAGCITILPPQQVVSSSP